MISAAKKTIRTHHRARNFVLYASVSIFIAFVGLKLTFVVQDRWGHDAFIRWGALTAFTLGLFALFIGDSEQLLRKARFWALAAILLVVHLAAFTILLTHVPEWKLMWFMVMVPEYMAVVFARDRFVSPGESSPVR